MTYKHTNGRLQLRNSGGRFKRAELADFNTGVVICPECGDLNPYEAVSYVPQARGFVLPQHNPKPRICRNCGKPLDEVK